MRMEIEVNGRRETWTVRLQDTLLDALRANGHTSAKRVCESGECGACAVIVDGLAIDSCLMLAAQAGGRVVVTADGLADGKQLHPVQEAFTENGAVQCGFCIPGMVVTAVNFLTDNPDPTPAEVRHAFVGNLCRCTGYKKPIEAVLAAAERMRGNP